MKKRGNNIWVFTASFLMLTGSASGYHNQYLRSGKTNTDPPAVTNAKAANCAPATSQINLELNNVRALVETGGSMFQNRAAGSAAYFVPKPRTEDDPKTTAIFAGALWMGGLDINGQLKLAAVRFRQNGNDFWAGPLSVIAGTADPNNSNSRDFGPAEIEPDVCMQYDKFFEINRPEVDLFNSWWAAGIADATNGTTTQAEDFPNYTVPSSILEWPAHGDVSKGQDFYLAPFYDRNQDGLYDPLGAGDYPWYDLESEVDCRSATDRRVTLFGDQTFWWIFNDKGNIHTETGSDPIGMEIRAQAFAFATNDEINSMTFYNYEMINRGTQTLFDTYFGQWIDADVGGAFDDYVGCDVARGLGYAYNGDANDEGPTGYGINPPCIAVDFFEGPYQDDDGIDNAFGIAEGEALNGVGYGDGVADNERFGMRRFLYHNNTGGNPNQTDPESGIDYYNYLRGIWKDGQKFVYGGSAHPSDPAADNNQNCDFMFPGDSDQEYYWGTQGNAVPVWTEQSAGNTPFDRRFMQSAGPFTLRPGAVNNITVGIVYARANSSDPFASVEKARVADDKAQALFDNCFKVLNGPDAPDITIQELENELVLTLSNSSTSNNVNESYVELDPFIPENIVTSTVSFLLDTATGQYVPDTTITVVELDRYYRFEGYQIFQLKSATVGPDELGETDKARLIAQCDLKNGVEELINYEFDEDLQASVPKKKAEGLDEGMDNGIVRSFRITQDEFAQGERTLVNHKSYYYMAIAYGYNNYKTFNPNEADALDGQKFPYIASRKSPSGAIRSYVGIPHNPTPEAGGTVARSTYGDGPEITRVEGQGNGSLELDFTTSTEATIVTNYRMATPTYQAGKGPINVKVIDPLNVPDARFRLHFLEDDQGKLDSSLWVLTVLDAIPAANIPAGETYTADKTIAICNEQLFPEFGFSIGIEQYAYTQEGSEFFTELIEGASNIVFTDSTRRWLTGVPDLDGFSEQNWIRSGTAEEDAPPNDIYNDYLGLDDEELYENILGGWWAPWRLIADEPGGPLGPDFANTIAMADIANLQSIDIVITNDQSLWTRCAVIELQEDPILAEGGAVKSDLRAAPSVGKDGQPDGTGNGMGWFPGYAINLETGERLNMAFGEDSWLAGDNGRDMKWNPSDRMYTNLFSPRFGGKHYIYVFNNEVAATGDNTRMPAYDEGLYLETQMNGSTGDKIRVYRSVCWVGLPLLEDGATFMSTDVRIRLRVKKPYETFDTGAGTVLNNWRPMYEWDMGNLATSKANATAADNALELINIVPNPYYGSSTYETSRLDNRVKLVNLPETCKIRIYNVKGTLVRTFDKDNVQTYLDWDLKNHVGIPISGGIYIIHVDVPDVGEKIIRWFGATRPTDLENF